MAALVTVTISTSDTWRVPRHVPGSLAMLVVGGGGGDYNPSGLTNTGGYSGSIRALLDIPRGTILSIGIGERGEDSEPSGMTAKASGGGGPRPGGDGGWYGSHAQDPSTWQRTGAGGGGATEILAGATVIAVAGGGGGGATKGGTSGSRAGDASIQTGDGDQGTPLSVNTTRGQGGFGGTTSAAGAGGAAGSNKFPTYVEAGFAGSGGDGGDGGSAIYVPGSPLFSSNVGGGGGGGGGYFGAGGGGGSVLSVEAGRGGGGSSWSNSTYVTEGAYGAAVRPLASLDGYVIFEYEPAPGRRGLGMIVR